MNIYDYHYLNMENLRERIKSIIEDMKGDNPRDKRIIYLIQAEELIKKAMMKGTIYR